MLNVSKTSELEHFFDSYSEIYRGVFTFLFNPKKTGHRENRTRKNYIFGQFTGSACACFLILFMIGEKPNGGDGEGSQKVMM